MLHVFRSSKAFLFRAGVGLAWTVFPLSCGSCQRTSPPAGEARTNGEPPTVILHAGARSIPFKVELARSEQEHAVGLMNRPSMPTDQGMLFIFEKPARQRFWMKNTLIPLDMLFIDEDRKVVGIVSRAEPLSLDDRSVQGKSQYVLEINGGLCDRLGIAPGSTVDFVAIPAP